MTEKKKGRGKRIVSVVIGLVVIVVVLSLLQRLGMPKYMGDVKEGALIGEYYDEEKDFDVVFIGDCEVYENFVPATLWENYGINSYIRGSAQQLIWQSYYLMEETLQYEKPDVIVFNVLSLQDNEPQKEAYIRMTIDGMRWSTSKVGCIQASMLESESFIEYVFPLLRYHDRWSELEPEDFKYILGAEKVGHNGYYMQVGVVPVEYIPEGKILGDYSLEQTLSYATSMINATKSGLTDVFNDLLKSRYGNTVEVTNLKYHESGGIEAEIGGDAVLMGSGGFMLRSGVRLNSGTNVKNAIYIAINRQPAGVFNINYKANNDVERARLFSCFAAYTHSINHNNDGKNHRNGKDCRIKALSYGASSAKRCNRCSM